MRFYEPGLDAGGQVVAGSNPAVPTTPAQSGGSGKGISRLVFASFCCGSQNLKDLSIHYRSVGALHMTPHTVG